MGSLADTVGGVEVIRDVVVLCPMQVYQAEGLQVVTGWRGRRGYLMGPIGGFR